MSPCSQLLTYGRQSYRVDSRCTGRQILAMIERIRCTIAPPRRCTIRPPLTISGIVDQNFGSKSEGDVMEKSDIRASLEELCAGFNAHDLDRIMNIFADDCILEMPRGPHPWGARAEGKNAVRELLATRFEGLPDVHYGDDVHFVDGETGISKWKLTGTQPTGQKIEVWGCDFYTFRDGKAIRKDSYWKIVE